MLQSRWRVYCSWRNRPLATHNIYMEYPRPTETITWWPSFCVSGSILASFKGHYCLCVYRWSSTRVGKGILTCMGSICSKFFCFGREWGVWGERGRIRFGDALVYYYFFLLLIQIHSPPFFRMKMETMFLFLKQII